MRCSYTVELYIEEAHDVETLELAGDRALPLTFGFEIEQPEAILIQHPVLKHLFTWERDPSDPMETQTKPSAHPVIEVRKFVEKVLEHNAIWEWVNEYEDDRGCGSHVHFRLREDLVSDRIRKGVYNVSDIYEAWAVTYNTFIEVTPFLIPILAWYRRGKPVHRFRQTIKFWAQYVYDRLTRSSMMYYLSPQHLGHPYYAIALNRKKREKPLTIEVRLAESPPQISMYYAVLMARIVDKCLRRGRSPMIFNRSTFFSTFIDLLYNVIYKTNEDVYAVLNAVTAVRFQTPIPELKSWYSTAFDVFRDIVVYYTPESYLFMRHFYFYYNTLKPHENWRAVWKVFAKFGDFYWEKPRVSDDEIKSSYYHVVRTVYRIKG